MNISFEYFPPNTDAGFESLARVHDELSGLKPEYVSITYGAGGSTRERTFKAVDQLLQGSTDVAPHISCIGDSKAEVAELLDHYKRLGIKRLVALRGDLPSGQVGMGELPFAVDLVRFIREHSGDHFHVEVAAYPEMHPQAKSFSADIDNLVAKLEAGANSAITQFFFNPESYFYLKDALAARGVDAPLVPGIMPITNSANLIRFSDGCGADVPRFIRKRLADFGDDTASILAFGEEVVTRLCERLVEGGAPALHFYSMNKAAPVQALVKNLGLA